MATIETYAVPTWLYRYRSLRPLGVNRDPRADRIRLERELSAIEEGYIWCSTFKEMNDPMEGFYRSSSATREGFDPDHFADAVFSEKLGLGIASFSESWNNELMWAHYADGFRGICVAYKMARLLSSMDDEHALTRLAYSDRPHFLNSSVMANRALRARSILSSKSSKWAYEREWRLFSPCPGAASYGLRVVPTVYLGMRMDATDSRMITHRLEAAGIRVKRTVVDGYSVKYVRPRG